MDSATLRYLEKKKKKKSSHVPREIVGKTQERPKSKMATDGHFGNTKIYYFGFWPLLGFAHTFARDMGAFFFFFSKYLKVAESTLKPSSALSCHGRSKYGPTIQCAIASFRFLLMKDELEGTKAENRF